MSEGLIEFVDYIFDRYTFLKLDPSASQAEVEVAIRNRRAQNHPDRLTNLDDNLKAQAEATWKNIDVCAAILLDPKMRPLYDERLKYFKENKPHLVTKDSDTQLILYERDYIDIGFLTSDQTYDLAEFIEMNMTATGYNPNAFERAKKIYVKDLTDPDSIAIYRQALLQKIEFLAFMEQDLWRAAGVSGKDYTESGEKLWDTALIRKSVAAQIVHVKNDVIPQFVAQRSELLALGVDKNPTLMLSYGGAKAELTEVQRSNNAARIEVAQSRFERLSKAIEENAGERAGAIQALLGISPLKMLHTVSADSVMIHVLVDMADGNDLDAAQVVLSSRHVRNGGDVSIKKLNDFHGLSLEELKARTFDETVAVILLDRTLKDPFLQLGHIYKRVLADFGIEPELAATLRDETDEAERPSTVEGQPDRVEKPSLP